MTGKSSIGSILRSPLTWMAMFLCGSFVWAFWTWFGPHRVLRAASILLAIAVFSLWPLLYIRTEEYLRAVHGLEKQTGGEEAESVKQLIEDFDVLHFKQGMEQVRTLRQKYLNLAEVLRRRLDSGEITYRRYLAIAESVYLASLENLKDVAILLRSISTIDPATLNLEIEELRKEMGFNIPEAIAAIEDRQELYREQRQRIAKLLAQTEAGMTALDHASAALARTRTTRGLTHLGIEEAMEELKELASRSGKYAAEAETR